MPTRSRLLTPGARRCCRLAPLALLPFLTCFSLLLFRRASRSRSRCRNSRIIVRSPLTRSFCRRSRATALRCSAR